MSTPLSRASSTVVALLSIVAAAGCASTRASGPAVDDALARQSEALIQLRSNGCASGRCPVYGVAIDADGGIVYFGGANVAFVGERRSKIPEASVLQLVSMLEKMDFIDTPDHCCDCPNAPKDANAAKLVIDYRPGGVEREVLFDNRCFSPPDSVRELIAQIQASTSITPFIATAPARPKAAPRLASDGPPPSDRSLRRRGAPTPSRARAAARAWP